MFRGVANLDTREVLFGAQMELKSAGSMYNGVYSGFTTMDEGILAALFTFVAQKIAEISRVLTIKAKNRRHAATLKLFEKLLENKTIPRLVVSIRTLLGDYLGYDYVGILYYCEKGTWIIKSS